MTADSPTGADRPTLSVVCPACGRRAEFSPGLLSCDCSSPLDPAPPRAQSDTRPGRGIWRRRDAIGGLPREASLGEGETPLLPVDAGSSKVFLKLEYRSPTGSYKDRGAAYCLSLLASMGEDSVVEDSSGNAGAAYAAYAAHLGMRCKVFVPVGAPRGKIAAIRKYGAEVEEVPGGREAAHDRARKQPSYAGHAWAAPFLLGVETLAYEALDQMEGIPPDEVILPAGQGGLLYSTYLAFRRLRDEGRIASLPVLTAVQAEACAPLFHAANLGADTLPKIRPRPTAADAIRIARPVRWRSVLRAVEETGGEWAAVSEEEIGKALDDLAKMGHDVEPASAVVWAIVLRRLRTREGLRERVLVPLTGSGRKGDPGGSPKTP